MIWAAYLLLGAIAGMLAGLFGIGGGAILVPAFVLLFSWQGVAADIVIYLAIGSSLACIAFSAMSSTWAHHKKGAVDWRIFYILAPGIMGGTWLGVHTVVSIPRDILQLIIGVFLVLMALNMLREPKAHGVQRAGLPGMPILVAVGTAIGWLSAIFGIGGGTITVPFLQYCSLNIQRAVATSAACGIPIAFVGTLTNLTVGWQHHALPAGAVGYVLLPAVVAVAVASVPGASLGAQLAHRLSALRLKKYFAALMILVGLWMTSRFFV